LDLLDLTFNRIHKIKALSESEHKFSTVALSNFGACSGVAYESETTLHRLQ
jgi:hypothetical protein